MNHYRVMWWVLTISVTSSGMHAMSREFTVPVENLKLLGAKIFNAFKKNEELDLRIHILEASVNLNPLVLTQCLAQKQYSEKTWYDEKYLRYALLEYGNEYTFEDGILQQICDQCAINFTSNFRFKDEHNTCIMSFLYVLLFKNSNYGLFNSVTIAPYEFAHSLAEIPGLLRFFKKNCIPFSRYQGIARDQGLPGVVHQWWSLFDCIRRSYNFLGHYFVEDCKKHNITFSKDILDEIIEGLVFLDIDTEIGFIQEKISGNNREILKDTLINSYRDDPNRDDPMDYSEFYESLHRALLKKFLSHWPGLLNHKMKNVYDIHITFT